MKCLIAIICAMMFMSCASNKVGDMANTINKLNEVDAVTSGMQIPIYSPDDGDARKASMSKVQDFMQDNLSFGTDFVQIFTIVRSEVVTNIYIVDLSSATYNTHAILTEVAGIGAAISFPTDPIDKQEFLVNTVEIMGAISAANPQPTTVGFPSSMAAAGFFKMKYDITDDTWYRVG